MIILMYSKYSRVVGENKSFILANSVIITDFSDYDWPSNVILNKDIYFVIIDMY